MEYKQTAIEATEVVERTVVGFAAIFGNVDGAGDRIHKGAFAKTIQESGHRVKHLWQHDMTAPPIATIKSLDEVSRAELPRHVQERFPDALGGLRVVRTYLDTPRADEILKGIKGGAITEMSFAFDPIKTSAATEKRDGKDIRIRGLHEVRLWETSDVVWGMNPATSATKSHAIQAMLTWVDGIIEKIGGGGELSPAEIEAAKTASQRLEVLLAAAEPPATVLTDTLKRRLALLELEG